MTNTDKAVAARNTAIWLAQGIVRNGDVLTVPSNLQSDRLRDLRFIRYDGEVWLLEKENFGTTNPVYFYRRMRKGIGADGRPFRQNGSTVIQEDSKLITPVKTLAEFEADPEEDQAETAPDPVHYAGVERHAEVWFNANRAAATTAAANGLDVVKNRQTIASIVLRVLDAAKPRHGWVNVKPRGSLAADFDADTDLMDAFQALAALLSEATALRDKAMVVSVASEIEKLVKRFETEMTTADAMVARMSTTGELTDATLEAIKEVVEEAAEEAGLIAAAEEEATECVFHSPPPETTAAQATMPRAEALGPHELVDLRGMTLADMPLRNRPSEGSAYVVDGDGNKKYTAYTRAGFALADVTYSRLCALIGIPCVRARYGGGIDHSRSENGFISVSDFDDQWMAYDRFLDHNGVGVHLPNEVEIGLHAILHNMSEGFSPRLFEWGYVVEGDTLLKANNHFAFTADMTSSVRGLDLFNPTSNAEYFWKNNAGLEWARSAFPFDVLAAITDEQIAHIAQVPDGMPVGDGVAFLTAKLGYLRDRALVTADAEKGTLVSYSSGLDPEA